MEKIKIEKDPKNDSDDDAASWYPFLDFLATKGLKPKLGNYPENGNIFLNSMNGAECDFDSPTLISMKEIHEKFEFHESVYFGSEALGATIYDGYNSFFFYFNLMDEQG